MKKMFSVSHEGFCCECLYQEGDFNPYRLYRIEWKTNKNGYPYKSKKLVEKYANLQSVFFHLAMLGI